MQENKVIEEKQPLEAPKDVVEESLEEVKTVAAIPAMRTSTNPTTIAKATEVTIRPEIMKQLKEVVSSNTRQI